MTKDNEIIEYRIWVCGELVYFSTDLESYEKWCKIFMNCYDPKEIKTGASIAFKDGVK